MGYWLNTLQNVPNNKLRAFVRKSGKIALRRRISFSFCGFSLIARLSLIKKMEINPANDALAGENMMRRIVQNQRTIIEQNL